MDRRARKKARTRAEILDAARRSFAARGFDSVTIADIAAEADVAVQTVFNHFATKEDLFFDGRTPWVEGAADAVRSRPSSVPPLRALREYLVELVTSLAEPDADDERRNYVATIEASPTLRARELEVVREAERRLTDALVEAWTRGEAAERGPRPEDPGSTAALTAATWLATARVLIVGQRSAALVDGPRSTGSGAVMGSLADTILGQLEQGLTALRGVAPSSVTGWPLGMRRAG